MTRETGPAFRPERAITDSIMNPNKALWEKGDFTRIASMMRESGEELVQSLFDQFNLHLPMRVLDLGCGDGTTAVPMARIGAEVVGIDIARNLVEAGNKRAKEEGLSNLTFQEGDACKLEGIADESFDMSISIFGAMFAPRPKDVAAELLRVTKQGRRIVMGNWIPNDPESFVSQLLKISAAYTPPPPEGFVSPMLWGVEEQIYDRFPGIPRQHILFDRETFHFRSDRDTADAVDTFRLYYGPTMNAFEAAEKNGKADQLRNELLKLAKDFNRSQVDGTTVIPATYLRVTVNNS